MGKIPVSASHSIVGATLGFHLVIFGGEGIDWAVVLKIGEFNSIIFNNLFVHYKDRNSKFTVFSHLIRQNATQRL